MKKLLLVICAIVFSVCTMAQVPNFGTTVGDQQLYGYSSMKYRAKTGTWETYSTMQYGITDYFQTGVDLYNDGYKSYIGYTVRGGYKVSDNFKIGAQFTPSFDLSDNHKFSYLTSSIYINGNISKDGRLFYVTDTWLENDKDKLTSTKQWEYIGYTFPLKGNGNSITPVVGMIHSWKFDENPNMAAGCYFTHKNISLYAWANDIISDHPRFVLAIEFAFSNK